MSILYGNIILLFISILLLLIVPIKTSINKFLKVIMFFTALGELLGIFGKILIVATKSDFAKGPLGNYFPSDDLMIKAILCLILYNLFFLFGIWLVILHKNVMDKKVIKNELKIEYINNDLDIEKKIKKILILVSIPGILLLIVNILQGNTLVSNSELEATRVDVAGTGPSILLKEIPITSLLLWFSFKNAKVSWKWWINLSMVLGMFLITGNRSAMVMAVMVLLAIIIQIKGIKSLLKKSHTTILLGLFTVYIGWIVVFVRGNLLKTGNNFLTALEESFNYSFNYIMLYLYRTSFNGFDGLISVLNNVPINMKFQEGQFLYEALTIIIPRSIWSSKWELQMTNKFTNEIWGWGQGGMFVTGPGVLFLDNGYLGVITGAFFLGIIIAIAVLLFNRFITDIWVVRFLVASTAYFSSRFLFAGGSNDVVLWQRLVLEAIFIYIIVVKFSPRLNFNKIPYSSKSQNEL